jgi:hypothetical protein
MGSLVDLTGKRFGRLIVKERALTDRKRTTWVCQCDCGKQKTVRASDLRSGHTQSCGCLHKEIVATSSFVHRVDTTSHGKSRTRIYGIWSGIKTRCYNKHWKNHKNYGGRGISVCEEWRNNFQAFYDWAMSNGYSDELTIDRIDVDGNYEPSNCRWITLAEQQKNRTNNKKQG